MARSILSYRPSFVESSRQGLFAQALRVWGPVMLAVAVIGLESTQTFGGSNTSGWLRPIFEKIFGRFSDPIWFVMHHYLRKSGHFIGYGLVCLSFLRAWLYTLAGRTELTLGGWRARACLLALLCTAGIASLDEWHQTMLPGRTGAAIDVVLDTCGASTMCLLVGVVFWRRDLARAQLEDSREPPLL